jgi:fimbrial isopeptide formation D2 family protein/LPXTG-motif cell wall-anchored protein
METERKKGTIFMSKLRQVLKVMLTLVMILTIIMTTDVWAESGVSPSASTASPTPVIASVASKSDTTGSCTITINDAKSGHTYKAYQIFTGDLAMETANGSTSYVLSNIEWGTGITSDGQSALIGYLKLGSNATADAVAGEISTDNIDAIAKKLSESGNLSDSTATASPSTDSTAYMFSGLMPGYYLIIDEPQSDTSLTTGDAYARYIVQVTNESVSITDKSSVPSVTKKVKSSNDTNAAWADAADYNIGDSISFQLTGTLPSTFSDYSSYKYEFVDTLSSAFTYDSGKSGLSVCVIDKDGIIKKTLAASEYTSAYSSPNLTITISNLKTLSDITWVETDKIVVTYKATLNAYAVTDGVGNSNEVKLVYSNNPNSTSTGTTVSDNVRVLTYELDGVKVDGTDTTKKLSGAEFKLYRMVSNTEEYVQLGTDKKVTGWGTAENASVITSDTNGTFSIIGLDQGTYYLVETKAPTGYNQLSSAIEVEITAASNTKTNWSTTTTTILTSLNVSIKETNSSATAVASTENTGNGDLSKGTVSITVANKKGITLPNTGGKGAVLFYGLGAVLFVAAAVLLVTRQRMKHQKEN